VVTLALLAAFVWTLQPPQPDLHPAPLEPVAQECPRLPRAFLASNATELPGNLLEGLTTEQKFRALYRLNTEPCPCGCSLSVAACRIENPGCEVSKSLAEQIVAEVRQEAPRR
jgi:hypothetical protein